MAIRDWPAGERPREKLLQKGAASLSDAELLAIFLRIGVKGKSALDLAREMLKEFGGLRALLSASQEELCATLGMGPAKYAQLQAGLEMARRHLGEALERGKPLTDPAATRKYLLAQLRDMPHEVFACLYLDLYVNASLAQMAPG
jgi:DNA repair protein RadC